MAGIFTMKGSFKRILKTVTGGGKDSLPTGDKVSFPILTRDQMTKADITTSRKAIAFYKKYMLDIGYLQKNEIDDFVTSLKEEFKNHEQEIKEELSWAKDTLAEDRAEFKTTKKRFSRCKDPADRDHLSYALASAEEEHDSSAREFEKIASELKKFKTDRTLFLINYINNEIHGPGWDSLPGGE